MGPDQASLPSIDCPTPTFSAFPNNSLLPGGSFTMDPSILSAFALGRQELGSGTRNPSLAPTLSLTLRMALRRHLNETGRKSQLGGLSHLPDKEGTISAACIYCGLVGAASPLHPPCSECLHTLGISHTQSLSSFKTLPFHHHGCRLFAPCAQLNPTPSRRKRGCGRRS